MHIYALRETVLCISTNWLCYVDVFFYFYFFHYPFISVRAVDNWLIASF